jgi:hypothetical protein
VVEYCVRCAGNCRHIILKMTNTKFELTSETKLMPDGTKLYRIRALMDLEFCKKGEVGGWIESEKNLDISGDAWVFGNAQVSGNACVYGNAWVYGNARVYGNAQVFGNAWVSGNARVYGDARVFGNACVYGDARVYGKIRLETILCSRFSFEFQWQIELWQKKEKEYEKEAKEKKGVMNND